MPVVSQLESSVQAISRSDLEPTSSPRISFSADFFVHNEKEEDHQVSLSRLNLDASHESHGKDREKACTNGDRDFEFFSNDSITNSMLTADELFFEGKLLPFWQMEQTEKCLDKITLTPKGQVGGDQKELINNKGDQECKVSWVMDDDPSPRPPTCTVLWKELLRLRKHRTSSLSSSSSSSPSPSSTSASSSTSSSRSSSRSSTSSSTVTMESMEEGKESSTKERLWNKEKHVKRIKKGLERTRSASFRMRPMVSVPICTHTKNSALSSFVYLKKGNV